MKEKIREEMKSYARTISWNCGEVVKETVRLASFVEDLLKYSDLFDTSLDNMDERYTRLGETYMLVEEEKRYINGASGVVPVDDRVKRELRLYEYAKPRLKDAYGRLKYCDEMWFFTTDTLASGWMDYGYIADALPSMQKMDLMKLHALRLIRLNWFDIVNPINNPGREGVWSPFPFVEMFGQWVFTFHYPVYEGDQFKGAFVPHVKIEPILQDSIYNSPEKMMAIHDDATLVGMNEAAEERFSLENYKFRFWTDLTEKVSYVRKNLSLMRNPSDDFAWLADGLRWQREFDLAIEGKNYTIIKERIPEIGMNLVALIDK